MKVTIHEHKDFLTEEDENKIVDPVDEVQDEAEEDKKESSESIEEQVKRLAKELELEIDDDMVEQLVLGMDVEKEHGSLLGDTTNITKDDEMMTFKIALAHVMEIPDYYDRLLAMEAEAEEMKESRNSSLKLESLASARARFKDLADTYKDLDPSPTFKYIEWICKVISEKGESIVDEMPHVINRWDVLLNKNQLPRESRDINQFTFDEVVDIIASLADVKSQSDIKKELRGVIHEESDVVFENDEWVIIVPFSERASNHYGQGTKWCISATQSFNSFNQYTYQYKAHFYFLLSKNSDAKYAFAMHDDTLLEVRNAQNKYMFFSGALPMLAQVERQVAYRHEPDPRLEASDKTYVFWMDETFFNFFHDKLEAEDGKSLESREDYYGNQPEEVVLNIPTSVFAELDDNLKRKIWGESKENKEWSEDVDTSWTPPKGLFTKSATEIANVLVDNSKDLKQAMSRLMFYQNRAGGKVETKELGKFNRVQNLLRAAYAKKKTESVVPVEEKIRSKFESGDYYFSLRSKEPGELRNLERKLRSAKGIVVQSIHPPTNTIIVKVAGANHKIARQLVRTVVDKMNVTVEGRKRVVM